MPRTRPPYPPEFRQQMVDLVKARLAVRLSAETVDLLRCDPSQRSRNAIDFDRLRTKSMIQTWFSGPSHRSLTPVCVEACANPGGEAPRRQSMMGSLLAGVGEPE